MNILTIRTAMPARSGRNLIRAIPVLLALFSSSLACPGCEHISGYFGFLQRHRSLEEAFQNQPRMELLREISPEGCFRLQGPLALGRKQDTPILAIFVSRRFRQEEVVVSRELVLGIPFYAAFIPEGDYSLFFFADLDRDGFFESHELVGQTPPGETVRVAADRIEDGLTVEGPKVGIDFDRPAVSGFPLRVKVTSRTLHV